MSTSSSSSFASQDNDEQQQQQQQQQETVNAGITSNECLSFYMPDLTIIDDSTTRITTTSSGSSSSSIQSSMHIHKEKLNILREIVSSEKKYVNDLKEIVHVRFYYYSMYPSICQVFIFFSNN